ncbi:MAG: class I tRNA ligase family protein [Planctomycetota bacterium]|nr:class I tRNA ligase family protein [Planctomycetota bacterium]MCZ6810871.1 class I tRNA ligase family protein [Planctomycetota bacterium]MCZ6851284.1 class I tRNA ligase family protein [Planctomycetota bacterium]
MPKRIYITTPIYYVNDKPHIGHAYTTTVCDVYARFMRFAGWDVFFLTGTDEHGLKVEKSAQARGISPQQLADENAAEFRRVMSRLGLTFDDFIRTTEPRHVEQVQAMVTKLLDTDAVYLGEFEGWYDEGQEEYHTETKARELDYKSPVSGEPLVRAKEDNYYFRLSAFQKPLERLFQQQPDFVRPAARRNEVLGRLREGLQDVPMSRTNFTWGVPMPNDPGHVIYVWIDALMNYITALGLGEPDSDVYRQRSKYWPATYHIIGKEILWFHAVIWPAILMALDLPLPKCVYAHSFWIREGQKMSKSLGNFIDLTTIKQYVDRYGLDAWRYYMATHGPLGATDADFRAEHFHSVYNTDLANTLGNCASRTAAMINKYFDGFVPAEAEPDESVDGGRGRSGSPTPNEERPDCLRMMIADHDWPAIAKEAVSSSTTAMEKIDLARSIGSAIGLVRRVDAFINLTEPYKLAKDQGKRGELGAILYQCLEAVRIASLLLWAVMPEKMSELWSALGLSIEPDAGRLAELAEWGGLEPGRRVRKITLFPRVDTLRVIDGAA